MILPDPVESADEVDTSGSWNRTPHWGTVTGQREMRPHHIHQLGALPRLLSNLSHCANNTLWIHIIFQHAGDSQIRRRPTELGRQIHGVRVVSFSLRLRLWTYAHCFCTSSQTPCNIENIIKCSTYIVIHVFSYTCFIIYRTGLIQSLGVNLQPICSTFNSIIQSATGCVYVSA